MDFDEYQRLSRRTMNTENQTAREQFLNASLGVAGEAGEVADLVKKAFFHQRGATVHKLALELGDVLFYLHWLADLAGYSLTDIAQMNVNKLAERYPNGFEAGNTPDWQDEPDSNPA